MSGFNVHDYSDILRLPHHQSNRHPRMSLLNRAAQFSPFAALTGYEDAIVETARLTDAKRELSSEDMDLLNKQIAILAEHLAGLAKGDNRPEIEVEYFAQDDKKAGGAYNTVTVQVKLVDEISRQLVLTDGRHIPLDDIFSLNGTIFDDYMRDLLGGL